MKKMTIARSIATIVVLFVLSLSGIYAQAPATVSAEASTLQKHGNSSAGIVSAYETIDSLSLGAQNVKYVAYPDLLISPSYVFPTTSLNSTFVWATVPSAGVSVNNTVAGFATNYAKINFPASTGDYVLSVLETATAGSCAGAAVGFTVRLINVPTANFNGTPNTSATCGANLSTVTLSLPVALTTAVQDNMVKLTYTISGANIVAATTVDLNKSATSFTLPAGTFTSYGANTITITAVSDHISRKSSVPGTITTATYSFTINRVPVTGPIYHVPNL